MEMRPTLSPSDADRVRRAFSCGKRADAGDGAGVELVGGRVTAKKDGEAWLPDPSGAYGNPESPSISDDGTQIALVYDSHLGDSRVMELISTAREDWKSIRCLSTMGATGGVAAADVAPEGNEVALVSKEGDVRVSPTYGHNGPEYKSRLVDALGARLGAADVEFLPGRRLAIATSYGTYLLMDLEGNTSCLPMRSFDPEGWESLCREAEERLAVLGPDERVAILDEFGKAAVAAHACPDGRLALVQIQRDEEHVENLVLERKTGRRASMGLSLLEAPVWSPTGLSLSHGSSARFSTLFPFSGFDKDDAANTHGTVVLESENAVVVNGVRVPRRVIPPG